MTNILDYGFVLIGIWILSEIILGRLKRSGESHSRQDKLSLSVLWVTIMTSIGLGVLFSVLKVAEIDSPYASYIGFALILIGLVIRWTAILTLWKYFTVDVAIASDHKLLVHGLYKFARHPSYTGGLISFLGLGLYLGDWASIAVIFVPVCAAFIYRITVEEKALIAHFGDEYRQYAAKTKRLVPGIY